uniref:Uncharacterized protein n=1 Tax=Hyaloperonospora arabidopsidis (strain Emoy2) TaxID=559515 RepID=M4BIT4_HYAAE
MKRHVERRSIDRWPQVWTAELKCAKPKLRRMVKHVIARGGILWCGRSSDH